MTNYNELRAQLPPVLTIKTLGGKRTVTIHNPPAGELRAVNSNGASYKITREDWWNAKAILVANPRNPWRSGLYTDLGEYFSYSLIYAAALLRHQVQDEPNSRHSPPLLRFHRKAQDANAA